MKTTVGNRPGRKAVFSAALLSGLLISFAASAEPVAHTQTASEVDWVSAGVSGIGDGSGDIVVSGVSGTVEAAYLYWHGIDNTSADSVYDAQTVTFEGNEVRGVSLGQASTNCWGDGGSQAFRADVTAYVTGDDTYGIEGLSAGNNQANGASLVVLFDDGDSGNNRDLAFFEGNDSDEALEFPGETDGWSATLDNIDYGGGDVFAEFHVADGQDFPDGSVTLSTANGNVVIDDSDSLWDGVSLPNEGTGRAQNGGLYDIHTFNITSAFGAVTGPASLDLDGQNSGDDCLGLLLVLMDLEPGSAPPPPPPPRPEEAVPVPVMNSVALALLVSVMLMLGFVAVRRS